jgi:repressor LexA
MEQLTPRQQEIFELIRSTVEETGLPPTRAEIAQAFGFSSPNAAEGHLRALARKGVIELIPSASRGIRITALAAETGLPVVGRVAAGAPILAQEYIEDYIDVAPHLFSPSANYLLRVRGMSMRDAGILNGDLLAVHRTTSVRSGQVVVARLGDEVTVKRLHRSRAGKITLLPENPDFKPIAVTAADELEIEGLGVGVIRHGKPL